MRLTTMLLVLFLLFTGQSYAISEEEEDIHTSIVSELTETMNDYFFYQRSTNSFYRNFQNFFQSPEIHLNGGSEYMHDFIINGLSFKDPLTGTVTATFSPKLFATKEIYDGYIPAQYGNVTSGLFLFKTPDVTKNFSGHIESLSDNFVGNKFDQNYYRTVVSGSMFNSQKIGFWAAVERRWLGDRSPSSLTDDVLLDGSEMLPNNSQSGWNYHGKVHFEISQKAKLISTFDGANDEWQDYRHHFNNIFYPTQIEHTPRYKDKTIGSNNTLQYKFTENTTGEVSFGYFKSEYLRGDGIILDNLPAYRRSNSNPYYDDYALFREGMTFADGFYESYYENYLHKISSYNQVQGKLLSTLYENHKTEAGFSYKRYTLRYYTSNNTTHTTNPYNSLYVNRYGFTGDGKESDSEDWRNSTKHPTEFAFYLTDMITLDKVTFELGLRLDRFDLADKELRSFEYPFSPDSQNYVDGTLDESDMQDTEAITKISKRLAVTVNPTARFSLYFNFEKNYQVLPYGYQYLGWDYIESRLFAFATLFSMPANEPLESNKLEIKISAQLSPYINISVSKKYLTYKNDIYYSFISPAYPSGYFMNNYTNEIEYNPFSVSFTFEKDNLNAFADVTYGDAKGYSELPSNYIMWSNSGLTVPFPKNPKDYSKEYIVTAGVSYLTPFEMKISALIKYESGYHYDPFSVYDAVTHSSVDRYITGYPNSVESEDINIIDLKLEREFQFNSLTITPFILVKNLLDEEIVTGVYEGSGSPTSTGFLETDAGQQNIWYNDPDYEPRYRFLEQNPRNFAAPRQIFLGLKASF